MGAVAGGCSTPECSAQESCAAATVCSHDFGTNMRQARVSEAINKLSKANCHELRSLVLEAPVLCVTFSPAADLIAVSSEDGRLTVYDADSWVPIQRLDLSRVPVVKFLPSGEQLVLADNMMGLLVYDTARWCQVAVLKHGRPVCALDILETKHFMAAGGEAHGVMIYDTKSWVLLHTLHYVASISSLAFGPWSDLLAVGDSEHKLKLYDANSWKAIEVWEYVSPVTVVTFSPGRRFIVVGTDDGEVIIYSLPGLQSVKTIKHTASTASIVALSFSGMGSRVGSLAVGDCAGQLSVYDSRSWCSTFAVSSGCPLLAVQFSPRGELLVVGDAEGQLTEYDPAEKDADSDLGLGALAPACFR